jgi:hypothetical protein
MNNIIKNIENNEMGIYIVMVVIILLICFLPTNNIITNITKNTGSLIIAFVCVCLFMLLDNRLAVLFLILLIVSYYKNIKTNLQEKFIETDEIPLNISKVGKALAEQENDIEKQNIKMEMKITEQKLTNALAEVNNEFNKNIQDSKLLCDKIDESDEAQSTISLNNGENSVELFKGKENFLRDKVPEVIREKFVKGGLPFNNQERAINFKDSELVKNLNGLATQTNRSGYDITGCRMINSNDNSIIKTYETLNGPPLASFDYDTLQKEFVGTPFYPLNN